MALLSSLQGALGGKEVARSVEGLVVGAADLRRRIQTDEFSSFCVPQTDRDAGGYRKVYIVCGPRPKFSPNISSEL